MEMRVESVKWSKMRLGGRREDVRREEAEGGKSRVMKIDG